MSSSSSTINNEAAELKPRSPRRWFLLALFSIAQFIDIYSASGTVLAIPKISEKIMLTIPQSIWVINGYALAFGALLLASGRLADVWNAKYTFISGLVWLGAFSLGLGFVENANGLIVLRVLQGFGAALTIPSAINLLVHIFEDEREQAIALSVFSASAAIANVIGLLIGGVLLLANYRWIFYLISLIVWPMALLAFFAIPNTKDEASAIVAAPIDIEAKGSLPGITKPASSRPLRKPKMDYFGTLTMTAALVLFIYGLTQANVDGWRSASTLATILVGFALFPVFFWVESRCEPIDALIAPSTWKIRNFALLNIIALAPSFWFFAVQSALSERMQLEGATPILVAVRFLPMGITAIVTVGVLQTIPFSVFNLKWRIVVGALLAAGSALMISFAQETVSYWALLFPAFIIGPAGVAGLFISINVAIIMSVPPEVSGVAGGVYNTMLQIGIAIGLAITTTLQTSYRGENPMSPDWKGYRYSFLFLMSVFIASALATLVFLADPTKNQDHATTLSQPSDKTVEVCEEQKPTKDV